MYIIIKYCINTLIHIIICKYYVIIFVKFFVKNKLILFIQNIKFNNNNYDDVKYSNDSVLYI